MWDFFNTYQYLAMSSLMLVVALLCVLALPRYRRLIWLGGLLCLPYGFVSYEFIPEYWDPRLTFHSITSPEDLLFCQSTGMIAMFAVLLLAGERLRQHASRELALRRYLGWGLLGWGTAQILGRLWPGDRDVMYATLVGIALVAGFQMSYRREQLWVLARGAGLSALFYLGCLLLMERLWPGFLAAWRPEAQLPIDPLGLPGFEITWGLAFGFCWPLYLFHVLDIRGDEPAPAADDKQ